MSKALKRRVIGNCIPAHLISMNLTYYASNKKKEDLEYAQDQQRACAEAIKTYLDVLPPYYTESALKASRAIAKRLFNKHFADQKFDTGKVFMVLHDWIYRLADEDLIDFTEVKYMELVRSLDDTIGKGLDGEYEDGIYENTKESIRRRYKSACRHVQKVHDLAVELAQPEQIYLEA